MTQKWKKIGAYNHETAIIFPGKKEFFGFHVRVTAHKPTLNPDGEITHALQIEWSLLLLVLAGVDLHSCNSDKLDLIQQFFVNCLWISQVTFGLVLLSLFFG